MAVIHLPYGEEFLQLEIADSWLGEIAAPRAMEAATDAAALVQEALEHPIGSSPLNQIARPGQRVALLIDDYTRRTPLQQMLPPVLEVLLTAGISDKDIQLVVASGSHRRMSDHELLEKLGPHLLSRFPVIQTAGDESQMVYLGVTGNGIPAWVHQAVVTHQRTVPDKFQPDLRIGIGMITPHMDAGFSGGGKIILPGACGAPTVDAFHVRQANDPHNRLGQVDAPLRQDLEQFVGEQRLLDFVVNAILTIDEQFYRCVAGDFVAAHRVGASFALQACGALARRRYPVVIASSYPHHQDLWQSLKGLWSGDLLTADGGSLILATPVPEGLGSYPHLAEYLAFDAGTLHAALQAGSLADAKSAATAMMIKRRQERVQIGLVTGGLSRQQVEQMGLAYYPTLEAGVEQAVMQLPEQARLGSTGILTHGGILLPLIP